jgi:Domain of unknown function (DUF6471)
VAATEKEWANRARRFVKAELKRAEVSYAELARRLKEHGLEETEASITAKLNRGTFAATLSSDHEGYRARASQSRGSIECRDADNGDLLRQRCCFRLDYGRTAIGAGAAHTR